MKYKQPVILLAAIVLVTIVSHYRMLEFHREAAEIPGFPLADWPVAAGLLMLLSMSAAVVLSGWSIHWAIQKWGSAALLGSRIGAYLGGYGIYPVAYFLGVVVGGQFGGVFGSILGSVGGLLGVGVGMFIVMIIVCAIGTLLGYLIGGLIHRIIGLI